MYNHQLDTFIRVAECKSFSKAAEQMFISAPAVIKQMNQLENRMEIQLFVRTNTGLELTQAGRALYEETRYLIDYCGKAVKRIRQAGQHNQNVIRIGVSPLTPSTYLQELLKRMPTKKTAYVLEVVPFENTPQNAVEILKNLGNGIDIVTGLFDQKLLQERRCAAMKLARVPIRCAVAAGNPLYDKEVLTLEELHGQRLMMIRQGWNEDIDRLRKELTVHHPSIRIVDFDQYRPQEFNRCVREGSLLLGVDLWNEVHPMLRMLPVKWNASITLGLMHASQPSRTVQSFLELVSECTAE